MWILLTLARVVLVVLALRGARWAYLSFIALGLAYFPLRSGFAFQPLACQVAFGARLAVLSLANVAHVVLFGIFFMISAVHFGGRHWSRRPALARAAIATLAVGLLVELAQGVTGTGNCRLRDLIPDSAGILAGAALLILSARSLAAIAAAGPADGALRRWLQGR